MKIIVLAIAVIGMMACLVPSQSYAICDVANARVVNVETVPFNSAGATVTRFYIASGLVPMPNTYYAFETSNQMFINHLNAAHAGNLQVRVAGNAAACPAAGAVRPGGTIVAVFRSSFQ